MMPNHVHALIYFLKTNKPINKIIGDGKRFMAYEIVKRLKETGQSELLVRLQNAVEPKTLKEEKSMKCGKILSTQKYAVQKSL